jgi:hypothetical protein
MARPMRIYSVNANLSTQDVFCPVKASIGVQYMVSEQKLNNVCNNQILHPSKLSVIVIVHRSRDL